MCAPHDAQKTRVRVELANVNYSANASSTSQHYTHATQGYAESPIETPELLEIQSTKSVKKCDIAHPTNSGPQKCPPTMPVPRLNPVTNVFASAIAAWKYVRTISDYNISIL